MPTIDEAIERACAAYAAHVGETIFEDGMRAALSAFLADVPVSEGMVKVGAAKRSFNVHETARESFKAMCAEHAEELNNDSIP